MSFEERDVTGNRDDKVRSDRLTVPPKQSVDLRDIARRGGHGPGGRKLPPEPGRTPRGSTVPEHEILPRKDKP
jgi:hypothetical protein